MSFVKVDKCSIFNIHDPVDIRPLTRPCLNFNELNEDKSRHDFRDIAIPMCNRGPEIESPEHLLLRCILFSAERKNLFNPLSANSTKCLSSLKQFVGNIIRPFCGVGASGLKAFITKNPHVKS